jgi:hypothetical protein
MDRGVRAARSGEKVEIIAMSKTYCVPDHPEIRVDALRRMPEARPFDYLLLGMWIPGLGVAAWPAPFGVIHLESKIDH